MVRLPKTALVLAVSFLCLGPNAWCSETYLVIESGKGIIEFLDPVTLKTHSSIRVDVSPTGTGLNGVFADPNGRSIYVEGPIGKEDGCCWLYSINLGTLQAKVVADVWGSGSRSRFIATGPGLLQSVPAAAATANTQGEGRHWQSSRDGRWWFGVKDGVSVDLYDVAQGKTTRSLAVPAAADSPSNESWPWQGVWLGKGFYLYVREGAAARLWSLSPESTTLGEGTAIPEVGQVPGCSSPAIMDVTAAGDRLFVNEVFGGKIDRRTNCDDVPGGVWSIDTTTGRLNGPLAAELHFWLLLPNADGSELYGITSAGPAPESGPLALCQTGR